MDVELPGPADHAVLGLAGPAVEVANPLSAEEATLRRAQLPGLLRALAYNGDRRQGELRLFEVGTVFAHPTRARAGWPSGPAPPEPGRPCCPASASGLGRPGRAGDDARSAVAAWHVVAEALRIDRVDVVAVWAPGALPPTSMAAAGRPGSPDPVGPAGRPGLGHRGRHGGRGRSGAAGRLLVTGPAGAADGRRVGWLEVDLGVLLDPGRVPRRDEAARPVSRFPSSDVDLAFVVADAVPADRVAEALGAAAGDLLESVRLFDVYRGPSLGPDRRSLAFRLRFCAPDRTLTDAEVGEVRRGPLPPRRPSGPSCAEAAAGRRLGVAGQLARRSLGCHLVKLAPPPVAPEGSSVRTTLALARPRAALGRSGSRRPASPGGPDRPFWPWPPWPPCPTAGASPTAAVETLLRGGRPQHVA